MAASQETTTVIRDWSASPMDAKKNLIDCNNAIRRGVVSIDPGNIGAGLVVTTEVDLEGAAVTDFCAVQAPANLDVGLVPIRAWVSAADKISVSILNPTGGGINPAAGDWEYLLVGNDQLVSQSV